MLFVIVILEKAVNNEYAGLVVIILFRKQCRYLQIYYCSVYEL